MKWTINLSYCVELKNSRNVSTIFFSSIISSTLSWLRRSVSPLFLISSFVIYEVGFLISNPPPSLHKLIYITTHITKDYSRDRGTNIYLITMLFHGINIDSSSNKTNSKLSSLPFDIIYQAYFDIDQLD